MENRFLIKNFHQKTALTVYRFEPFHEIHRRAFIFPEDFKDFTIDASFQNSFGVAVGLNKAE